MPIRPNAKMLMKTSRDLMPIRPNAKMRSSVRCTAL